MCGCDGIRKSWHGREHPGGSIVWSSIKVGTPLLLQQNVSPTIVTQPSTRITAGLSRPQRAPGLLHLTANRLLQRRRLAS